MTPHLPNASSSTPLSSSAALGMPLQRPDAWRAEGDDSHFIEAGADHAACGMPAERHARMAAQRAFVALKLSFIYVVDSLPGQTELQCRVRLAEEPHDLWTLRAPVFAALTGNDPQQRSRRQLLNRSLDTMFPSAALQLN